MGKLRGGERVQDLFVFAHDLATRRSRKGVFLIIEDFAHLTSGSGDNVHVESVSQHTRCDLRSLENRR